MAQRDSRLIGGIYQVGQVMTTGPILTIATAYNRNSGDAVGLNIIELAPSMDESTLSLCFRLWINEGRYNPSTFCACWIGDWRTRAPIL